MQSTEIKTESPKLKIKTIIKEEREIDIEVSLPYFCQFNNYTYIKVLSNEKSIVVNDYGFEYSLKISDGYNDILVSGAFEISECKFNEMYSSVLSKLQNEAL